MNDVSPSATMNRQYRTSDLYFSAYLRSIDFPLVTTEQVTTANGGRKVVFVFNIEEADLARAKALYFGGSATVKARVFVDNLKGLKQMCNC